MTVRRSSGCVRSPFRSARAFQQIERTRNAKLAIATCALVALTSAASADYIQGALSMWPKGIVSGVGSGQTIQFTGGQQFPSSFTTHDLVAFEGASFTMGCTGDRR